jgi:hypothetical protein
MLKRLGKKARIVPATMQRISAFEFRPCMTVATVPKHSAKKNCQSWSNRTS